MKVLVVAVFVCVIGVAMCGDEEEFKKISDECAKESGVGADAWKNVEDQKLDDPKMGDFLFCVFQEFNFLNDKGEYQIEAIKAGLTEMVGEEVADKFIKDCTKEAKATGPETALEMIKCSKDIFPKSK